MHEILCYFIYAVHSTGTLQKIIYMYIIETLMATWKHK